MTCQHRRLHSLNKRRSLHGVLTTKRRTRMLTTEGRTTLCKAWDGGAIGRMGGVDHDGEEGGERKEASRRDDDAQHRALVRPRVAVRQSASSYQLPTFHRRACIVTFPIASTTRRLRQRRRLSKDQHHLSSVLPRALSSLCTCVPPSVRDSEAVSCFE